MKYSNILAFFKKKATGILLFSYGIVFGTFSPFLLSGCGNNCGNCGYCGLFLGILPLVLFLIIKNRLTDKISLLISSGLKRGAKGGKN